jgi:hypothetical protein
MTVELCLSLADALQARSGHHRWNCLSKLLPATSQQGMAEFPRQVGPDPKDPLKMSPSFGPWWA